MAEAHDRGDGRSGDAAPPGPPVGAGIAAPLSGARLLAYLLLVGAGLAVGAAGALVQAAWFPGGLLLALAGAAGCFHGGARLAGRAGALLPAGGWLLAVILLTTARPEGDFLFAASAGSYVFLGGGTLLAVVCAMTAGHVRP